MSDNSFNNNHANVISQMSKIFKMHIRDSSHTKKMLFKKQQKSDGLNLQSYC